MKKQTPSGIQIKNKLPKPSVDFLNLLRGVVHIGTYVKTAGMLGDPVGGVMDIAGSFKLETDPGTKVWGLITRSLKSALFQLLAESNQQYRLEEIEIGDLDTQLNQRLETGEYYITEQFFRNPAEIDFIKEIRPLLQEYLSYFGFTEVQTGNMLERLNCYFIYSLKKEWLLHMDHYQEIQTLLQSPFNEAEEKELEWDTYLNDIQQEIRKPVFSETFSLEQVYIPLRAAYKEHKEPAPKSKAGREELSEKEMPKEIVVDLQTHLMEWLEKGDKNDSIRIIRGGPGYGKSSCLKMLATGLALRRKKVLFIPLHRFDVTGKLDKAIRGFLKYDKYFSYDIINESNDPLILLLDGLDELSMRGKVLTEVAQSFLREINRCVPNYNNRHLKLQVIISGRDVIVQQNEQDFRQEGQILRLLPYYVAEEKRGDFIDPAHLLEEDQREAWWKKYGLITGHFYTGMPNELKTEEIDEITAQPLLNFLVALSYQRGKVQFNENTNLNEIYADLLEEVYKRGYSETKTHQVVSDMKQEHFCAILQEIALCAWHGKGRTTTVKEINTHFDQSGLMSLRDRFISDAEKGIVSLLVAFYFRQAGQTVEGSQTFEFTHKSFGEYLTATKIVNHLKVINEQLTKNEKDIYKRDGWDIKRCLEEWVRVFGEKTPDLDLVRFVWNELRLEAPENTDVLLKWQQTIVQLINHVLQFGMPMESFPGITYFEANRQAINAERALLVLHSLVAEITNIVSDIKWPESTSFGEFISRISGQRTGSGKFILRFCNHINISNSILYFFDLYMANLRRANLTQVILFGANLTGADLTRADLTEADLIEANLRGADLIEANLIEAYLTRADLTRADLTRAYLTEANLTEADLTEADLTEADLARADLTEANLTGADLTEADFIQEQLDSAIIEQPGKRTRKK